MPTRRFPPPWTAEVAPNCFIVRDAEGKQLAYVYYESEPGRQSAAKDDKADCSKYREVAGVVRAKRLDRPRLPLTAPAEQIRAFHAHSQQSRRGTVSENRRLCLGAPNNTALVREAALSGL